MIALLLSPIYLLINFYILRWILRWMGACTKYFKKKWFRITFIILYIFVSTSLVTPLLIKEPVINRFIKQISNLFLGTFLYILLIIVIVDFIRIILKRMKSVNQERLHSRSTFVFVGSLCTIFVISLSAYGILHARNIYTTTYDITIDKPMVSNRSLKIALVADLHLGYSIGNWHMQQMVDKINKMNPDLVCIAGDIFDNEFSAVKNPESVSQTLRGIKSKYGVYASWGNHDVNEAILAGFTFDSSNTKADDKRMADFLKESNIQLLEDESKLINNEFYLIGRQDYSLAKKFDIVRKEPRELTNNLDKSKPIITIDHQPKELQTLADAGVDLDLSGHTHDGQMFPGNLFIKLMWENSWGYLKKDNMHNIVTSGVGVWGPNMRIGTQSEVVEVNVIFKN